MLHPARSAVLFDGVRSRTDPEGRLQFLRDITHRLRDDLAAPTPQSILSLGLELLECTRGALLEAGGENAWSVITSHGEPDTAAIIDAVVDAERASHGSASSSALLETPPISPPTSFVRLCASLAIIGAGNPSLERVRGYLVLERPSAFDAGDVLAIEIFAAEAAKALRIERDRADLRRLARNLEVARDNEARWRRIAEHSLDAARQELDTFTYTVSHDLRAPVRHINSFVAMLRKHAGAALDETATRHLDIISTASRRLGRMVDDLLGLARIDRALLSPADLDLARVAGEVIEYLRPRCASRRIEWLIRPMPMVLGDRELMRIALTHLIDNAIKFTAPRELSRIEIGCARSDEKYATFYVKDDGVGFDSSYAHKLFQVFQRLHHVSEFEGTGVGLACVRRVIERHGGTVCAEGAAYQGAMFSFSLPRRGD